MKKLAFFLVLLTAAYACKKDKTPASPQPVAVKTGNIHLNVISYDSLGNIENDKSGISVSLYQTSYATVTNSTGIVDFNGLSYGSYLPVLVKIGYEGVPLSVSLNSSDLTLTLPLGKYSAYKITNFYGQIVSPDSIPVSFNLDRPVPAGKVCKLAVLFSKTPISPVNYDTADSVSVTLQSTTGFNVSKLPNLHNALNLLASGATFYVNVVPASGGIYQSNIQNRQVVVGDNLYPPNYLTFTK